MCLYFILEEDTRNPVHTLTTTNKFVMSTQTQNSDPSGPWEYVVA